MSPQSIARLVGVVGVVTAIIFAVIPMNNGADCGSAIFPAKHEERMGQYLPSALAAEIDRLREEVELSPALVAINNSKISSLIDQSKYRDQSTGIKCPDEVKNRRVLSITIGGLGLLIFLFGSQIVTQKATKREESDLNL